MEVRVGTLSNYRIAYMRQVGPYGPANIQVMQQLKAWAAERGLLTESAVLFGIPQDNPQVTHPEKCRYDACIVIAGEEQADDAVHECELAGGDYVIFKIKHTAEDVRRAWAEIFPAVHRMGFQLDDKPILEKYSGSDNDYCEIYVPIKR